MGWAAEWLGGWLAGWLAEWRGAAGWVAGRVGRWVRWVGGWVQDMQPNGALEDRAPSLPLFCSSILLFYRPHPPACLPTPPRAPCLAPQDMQRPLYMQPKDALEYGVIDGIVTPEKKIIDDVKSADQWDKEAGLVAR